jgi:arylsulfatase A-like enzyme
MKLIRILSGALIITGLFFLTCHSVKEKAGTKPNIIFLLADDLGYGDVGFMGNTRIKTPHLDEMAENGVVFNRFYAGAAVCSPTRGSCLTGRHYYRYGVFFASSGYLPSEEITLARVCKEEGYTTGHFGKWHLGPLALTGPALGEYKKDRERKYAPPWERDYDESFVTECNNPTWNPMDNKRFDSNSRFAFFHNGEEATENLEGAAARIVMDRAIPFIRNAVEQGKPFMATIWFLEPHDPVVAGPEYKAMYSEYSDDEQHYYGCVTAMDEQVGRLRKELEELGIAGNTMIWFCSDNGPAHYQTPDSEEWWFSRSQGETGGLRGRKRSFFEGGIRVPGILEWPGHVQEGKRIDIPASTLDFFPTVQSILNYEMPDQRPIDGINLLPVIIGEISERPKAIPFCKPSGGGPGANNSPNLVLIDGNFKFMTNLSETGKEDLLFDLDRDSGEQDNIIENHPEVAAEMKAEIIELIESFRKSHAGDDYDTDFKPVNRFPL